MICSAGFEITRPARRWGRGARTRAEKRKETNVRRLEGQVALVTGASGGIGGATAVALAREGAQVAVTGRRLEALEMVGREIEACGAGALVLPGDLTDPQAVERILGTVVAGLGRLDILVNCAGANIGKRSLQEIGLDGWLATLDANLTAPFLCARAALPRMRAQGHGTIVNIVSQAARYPTVRPGVAYSTAKSGLLMLTQYLNMEERPNGIRACALLPGEVNTPILAQRPTPPTAEARALMLQPEDVAATVIFVVTLPQRVTVEELLIRPTAARSA
jgi:NAD(P)-dependent dehydrogenase (short-subunit alcohol dehydrogenase family)